MARTDAPMHEDSAVGWHALGQGGLSPRIREEILRMLAERGLQPGDQLPSERELAATLRVSRPSVREAVRSLQAEGRLIVRHGRGVFVSEPTSRQRLRAAMTDLDIDLSEMFAMREVLEVPAARWAAEIGDETALAAVQNAYESLERALGREPLDYEELGRLDSAFHLRIVQAADNRLLEQSQAVLSELLSTGMRSTLEVPGRIARSRFDHQQILAALLAGDPESAARAAGAHVRGARDAANARLLNGSTPSKIPRVAAD
jgi:GntR family transcriptional regulator, transcriptional repressor for pyruvate dehydrogenase complex